MEFNKNLVTKLEYKGWKFSEGQKDLFKYYYGMNVKKIGIQSAIVGDGVGFIILGENEQMFLSKNNINKECLL